MGIHYVIFAGVVLCLMKGLRFAGQTSFLIHRRSRIKAACVAYISGFAKEGGGGALRERTQISIRHKAYS